MNRAASGLLLPLLLVACGEKPGKKPKPAPAPAPAAEVVSEADRRARFLARPVVKPPIGLPRVWAEIPRRMEARLGSAVYEQRSRWDRKPPYAHVELALHLFGRDAAVQARLLAVLGALKLSGLGSKLPEGPVTDGDVTWSLKVRRFVAPPGEAREAIATLRWTRAPPDPEGELPRCRKPRSVQAPKEAPRWMVARTKRMTTRHRIGVRVEERPDERRISMYVLYRNGETLSGELERLVLTAKRLGLKPVEQVALRQRWGSKRGTLEWRAETRELGLGCRFTGPVLELSWVRPRSK